MDTDIIGINFSVLQTSRKMFVRYTVILRNLFNGFLGYIALHFHINDFLCWQNLGWLFLRDIGNKSKNSFYEGF